MNWANWNWAGSLDQLWHSSTFSSWVILAAAGLFGLVVLITLLRAERTVANGALIVITLLAVGIGVAAIVREPAGRLGASGELLSQAPVTSLPALSCIDDLAGDAVLSACERTLFGSAGIRCRCGQLCSGTAQPSDGAWGCLNGRQGRFAGIAGASPLGGARPVWPGGTGAARTRSLPADAMHRVPIHD